MSRKNTACHQQQCPVPIYFQFFLCVCVLLYDRDDTSYLSYVYTTGSTVTVVLKGWVVEGIIQEWGQWLINYVLKPVQIMLSFSLFLGLCLCVCVSLSLSGDPSKELMEAKKEDKKYQVTLEAGEAVPRLKEELLF